MLKQQTFQQLHAAFLNGRMTTPSQDHYGHITHAGGGNFGVSTFSSEKIKSVFIM